MFYIYIYIYIYIYNKVNLDLEITSFDTRPYPTHTHTHTMPHLSLDSAVLLFDSGVLLSQKQKTSYIHTFSCIHTRPRIHTFLPMY